MSRTDPGRRLDERLREVVAERLSRMGDPRLRLITVTGTKLARDFSVGDVFVAVHGDERRTAEALDALEHARGALQASVNTAMHLRRTPRLRFHLDATVDTGMRVSRLIDEVAPVDPPVPAAAPDDGDGEDGEVG